jgi:hypothetical protein
MGICVGLASVELLVSSDIDTGVEMFDAGPGTELGTSLEEGEVIDCEDVLVGMSIRVDSEGEGLADSGYVNQG